jgi:amino acid permease
MKLLYYLTFPITLILYFIICLINKILFYKNREKFLEDWRKANKYVDDYNASVKASKKNRLSLLKSEK